MLVLDNMIQVDILDVTHSITVLQFTIVAYGKPETNKPDIWNIKNQLKDLFCSASS